MGSVEMASQSQQKVLWVQGMMLEASAARLEAALSRIDGVGDVKASYADSKVWLSYDPQKVKMKAILKAIESVGMIASEKPPAPETDRPAAGCKTASQGKAAAEGGSGTSIRRTLKVDGMTCTSCELRIENRLKKTRGVLQAKVSYSAGTAAVRYDPRFISVGGIVEIIEKLDYKVVNGPDGGNAAQGKRAKSDDKISINQFLGIAILFLAAYLILKNTIGFNFIPNISQNMGLGILFVVGLITSLHCVAMCGGINLSQNVSREPSQNGRSRLEKLKPSILYNAGRVISYTLLGGVVGALGSAVSFSGMARGIVSIVAGLFMVIMGLNMLNIFPWLRRFTPHMPKVFARKFHASGRHGPFFVGLFTGLMPCGPLQAMQIYALGTGSPVKGALSMLVFSLGTVPLMFGFGAVSSFLSSRFTRRMLKFSAALVMVLGVVMLGRGFSLSGISFAGALTPKAADFGAVAKIRGNAQLVSTTLQPNNYTPITVQKGVPVRWTIKADAGTINGCNGTVTIPQYNISKPLQPGDNEIDFIPRQTGTITYTCSMGMITSTISVVPDVTGVKPSDANRTLSSAVPSAGVGVAKVSGQRQSVTVSVDTGGYTPNILVLQKGVPAVINFDVKQLTGCDGTVVLPELGGSLDLSTQKSTPSFTPQSDFSFECGMGMLRGYVKVVDDINHIDIAAIKNQAKGKVASGGGMACCG